MQVSWPTGESQSRPLNLTLSPLSFCVSSQNGVLQLQHFLSDMANYPYV